MTGHLQSMGVDTAVWRINQLQLRSVFPDLILTKYADARPVYQLVETSPPS